jgi:hypothetical protein
MTGFIMRRPVISDTDVVYRGAGGWSMGDFSHNKWNAAAVRFCEFVRNIPLVVDEEDVATYNDIIEEFEDSSGMDLSRFRATAERTGSNSAVKPAWQTKLPARVSRDHFVSTVLEFAQYLRSSISPLPCDPKPS